jgi:hypothetical protein
VIGALATKRRAGPRSGANVASDRQSATSTGQPAGAYRPPDSRTAAQRLASHPVTGFIPWITFWVVGGVATWETGTVAALLAAILVTMLGIGYRPPAVWGHLKLLDIATVAFFALLSLAGLVATRHTVSNLDKYSQAISSGALGIIALGSVVFRHPFTLDYARQKAPPEVWHTAVFHRINRVLSSVWAAVFLLCALLGLAAQQSAAKGMRDWLNWYLPVAAIFLAFRFTKWYPEQVRTQQGQEPDLRKGQGVPDCHAASLVHHRFLARLRPRPRLCRSRGW